MYVWINFDPPKFESHEEEMRYWRERLRQALACSFDLFQEHITFVREHPEHAEWVKARVPPDVWARVDDAPQTRFAEYVPEVERAEKG